MMRKTNLSRRATAIPGAVLAAAACATVAAPLAQAVSIAPGAPMRTHAVIPSFPGMPAELDSMMCTQGPVGTVTLEDGTRRTVMAAAGHCVNPMPGMGINGEEFTPTSEVFSPKATGDEKIGTVDKSYVGFLANDIAPDASVVDSLYYAFATPDWSFTAVDDPANTSRVAHARDFDGVPAATTTELTGVKTYSDLPAKGSSFDNAGQPICKYGQTTGHTCGTQLFRMQDAIFAVGLDAVPGDSGGINYDPNSGQAIGMTSQRLGTLSRTQPLDSALNEAYGITDDQVNERFVLPDSTAAQDPDLRSGNQDGEAQIQWMRDNNAHPANPILDAVIFGDDTQTPSLDDTLNQVFDKLGGEEPGGNPIAQLPESSHAPDLGAMLDQAAIPDLSEIQNLMQL